jgi:hypothetical protein
VGLADLTDPEAVRAAIREYDELGQEAFLDRYGFGAARDWVLVYDGREYDSKAIVGAAHGVQHPERGPLRPGDFTGGRHTTVAKLRSLGFEVRSLADAGEQSPTFAFTAEDCALFANYPHKVRFSDELVPPEDKAKFKSIWERLKAIAAWVAQRADVDVPLRSDASSYSQNGLSQTELWSCAFPASVPNKSYGLQVAIIVSAHGAELCVCLGAGQSQISDEAKRAQAEQAMAALKEALRATPGDVRERVLQALAPEWQFRRRWRQPPGSRDFDDLDSWLAHAASLDGDGRSSSSRSTSAGQLERGACARRICALPVGKPSRR